ncbi:MAG: hypothetical protein ACLP8A_11370 [Methylovirgula sp.]
MSGNGERPLAKTIDALRQKLQALLPGASHHADAATMFDPQSRLPRHALERLLAGLPDEAFKGRQINVAKEAICKSLVEQFQSIGKDCEFGLVQRHFGAEPLDLFRFAASTPQGLITAIERRLAALENPDNFYVEFDGEIANGQPLLAVVLHAYNLRFHAGHLPAHVSFDTLKTNQAKKLNLLARKFLEDLAEGKRIFLCKCEPSMRADVLRLSETMRRLGPTELLWVTPEEVGKPAGLVERLSDGLLRGYIDRFADADRIWEFSTPLWLKICCDAYRLHISPKKQVAA